MLRAERGFTLIEVAIVVVIIGFLAAIAIPNYRNMTTRAQVAQVKATMHMVQTTCEDFATRNDGQYPPNAAAVTSDGGLAFGALLPAGGMPLNPWTQAPTTLDWSNVLGAAPITDVAGGVALNVVSTIPGGPWDAYDIIGEDDAGAQLTLVLTNQ